MGHLVNDKAGLDVSGENPDSGVDVRPANGKLYGTSNVARLYVIDPLTGASTPVGGPTATITG
jgi:hypothetical protein